MAIDQHRSVGRVDRRRRPQRRRLEGNERLTGGGPDGNERLTAAAGVLLLVLFAVLGVTILRIGQLLWLHLFLGMLLIGPVLLKLASTGYRFARYYTANPAYRRKGPPATPMRLLAPLVVLSTVVVFGSGVALLFAGPSAARDTVPDSQVQLLRLARRHGSARARPPGGSAGSAAGGLRPRPGHLAASAAGSRVGTGACWRLPGCSSPAWSWRCS